MFVNQNKVAQNSLLDLFIDSQKSAKTPLEKMLINQFIDDTTYSDIFADKSINNNLLPIELGTLPNNIFFIGGTELAGAFLIYKLLQQTTADIYCLVEADNFEQVKLILQRNLQVYGIFEEEFNSRIIPLIGNESKTNLGISKEGFEMLAVNIDSIYHCSSTLDCLYPNSAGNSSNYLGIKEVLRLSSLFKPKTLHMMLFPIS